MSALSEIGSPPRVRGTGGAGCACWRRERITPACAGNRVPADMMMTDYEDHPRVCGEQAIPDKCKRSGGGSPPRVRGTGPIPPLGGYAVGITPACAGNSDPCPWRPFLCQDHPRVCGEQAPENSTVRCKSGSPPRVRGTEAAFGEKHKAYRITPACAGNSDPGRSQIPVLEDHPRVCGEQKQLVPEWVQEKGSPPRVRGTGAAAGRSGGCGRITPACAGNSRPPHRSGWPHSGSPPRVRGTGRGYLREPGRGRITPACAGNRARPENKFCALQDHPRVCGEQLFRDVYKIDCVGSPPRVRGTAPWVLQPDRQQGITPACAGNRFSKLPNALHN